MIVRTDHKYELRSRTTGRVLGTHPSYARALRQERAIKASQARVARHNPWVAEPTYVEWSDDERGWCVLGADSGYCYAVFPKRDQAEQHARSKPIRTGRVYEGALANPAKSLHELQAKWREEHAEYEKFHSSLESKYQRAQYASKGELSKLDKLKRASDRAADRVYAWLEKHSPWSFQQGVNTWWIRERLTEQQALSAEPPLLPAEAASYGYEAREFRPARKNPRRRSTAVSPPADPRALEPGETGFQHALRRWTVPVLGIGAVAALFWWMSRPPQLLQASQIALQQRPFPDLSTLTDAQRTQIVRVAQTQLKQLGYPVTSIDGVSGPETQAAMTSFISANANAITNSASRYGQGEQAIILTLDDVYRRQFGLSAAA